MTAVDRFRTVIDTLSDEGAKVTIEAVRMRAGGGSARDVSAAINAWKEEHGEVVFTAREQALVDAIADRVCERLRAEWAADAERERLSEARAVTSDHHLGLAAILSGPK